MLAIVSSLAPLKVVVKGTTVPVPIWRYSSSAPSLAVGEMVWVDKIDRKYVLQSRLQNKISDTGWQSPVYEDGWEAYNSQPTNVFAFRYRRIGNTVFYNGLVKGNLATGNTIFTLPVGYRPSRRFLAAGFDSTSAVLRFDVDTNGITYSSSRPTWMSLNPVTFPTNDAWPT